MSEPEDKIITHPSTPDDTATAATTAATEAPPNITPSQGRRSRATKSKAPGRRKARKSPRGRAGAKSNRRAAAAKRQSRVSGRFVVTPAIGETPDRPISSYAELQQWLERRRGRR